MPFFPIWHSNLCPLYSIISPILYAFPVISTAFSSDTSSSPNFFLLTFLLPIAYCSPFPGVKVAPFVTPPPVVEPPPIPSSLTSLKPVLIISRAFPGVIRPWRIAFINIAIKSSSAPVCLRTFSIDLLTSS